MIGRQCRLEEPTYHAAQSAFLPEAGQSPDLPRSQAAERRFHPYSGNLALLPDFADFPAVGMACILVVSLAASGL